MPALITCIWLTKFTLVLSAGHTWLQICPRYDSRENVHNNIYRFIFVSSPGISDNDMSRDKQLQEQM